MSGRQFARIANGVTRFGLTLAATRSLPILLPPLSEQRAIAAVLDSIDEAIERTEAVIAATERLRDALLHELLTRGVRGWHSAWKDAPGLGTIPASWAVVRLGEVLESTTYGTNEPLGTRGEMVVLRMNNLQNGELDLSEVRRADLSKKEVHELNLVRGDILFNRTNSLDLVGKVGVVRNLPELISFASYLIRLRTVGEPRKLILAQCFVVVFKLPIPNSQVRYTGRKPSEYQSYQSRVSDNSTAAPPGTGSHRQAAGQGGCDTRRGKTGKGRFTIVEGIHRRRTAYRAGAGRSGRQHS